MRRILTSTALVIVTAMPSFAEIKAASDAAGNGSQEMMEPAGNRAASAEGTQNGEIAELLGLTEDVTMKATQMLGHTVYIRPEGATDTQIPASMTEIPSNWENIGEIGDVVLSADGDIDSVALDVGGFLGFGEKTVHTSMDNLHVVDMADADGAFLLVYTGDRSTLERERDFDAAAVELDGYSTWTQQRETLRLSQQHAANSTGDTVLTAEELQGMPVIEKADENVGEISQLVLDDSGRIEHVIVDVGGFLGLGEKPVAIAFEDIEIVEGSGFADQVARIDLTEETLKSMDAWQK